MVNLEKRGGIADVVSDGTLGSDSNLVLVYGGLRLRFLDLLVPIHGLSELLRNSGERREMGTLTLKP